MTVLYDYWRSSAAYRLRIALAHLGEEYASVTVNLLENAQSEPDNLARNPQGLVPTLEIDGLVLNQSLAVLEYLDETRDPGFLPKDPAGRAKVRALSYAIAMEIHPICNLHVVRHAVEASAGAITTESWMQHFITRGLSAIEAMLSDAKHGYCYGSKLSMADICLVPQIYNARRWGVDLSALSKISAVIANLETHPAVQAAHPDNCKP